MFSNCSTIASNITRRIRLLNISLTLEKQESFLFLAASEVSSKTTTKKWSLFVARWSGKKDLHTLPIRQLPVKFSSSYRGSHLYLTLSPEVLRAASRGSLWGAQRHTSSALISSPHWAARAATYSCSRADTCLTENTDV